MGNPFGTCPSRDSWSHSRVRALGRIMRGLERKGYFLPFFPFSLCKGKGKGCAFSAPRSGARVRGLMLLPAVLDVDPCDVLADALEAPCLVRELLQGPEMGRDFLAVMPNESVAFVACSMRISLRFGHALAYPSIDAGRDVTNDASRYVRRVRNDFGALMNPPKSPRQRVLTRAWWLLMRQGVGATRRPRRRPSCPSSPSCPCPSWLPVPRPPCRRPSSP